jgi:hypothetical protein
LTSLLAARTSSPLSENTLGSGEHVRVDMPPLSSVSTGDCSSDGEKQADDEEARLESEARERRVAAEFPSASVMTAARR